MRTLVLASAALALLSGCVFEYDDDDVHRGRVGPIPDDRANLAFFVTLDGRTCEEVPEVDQLRLRLDGPGTVADDLRLCPPAGTGLEFPDLLPGSYTWRIDALDANRDPLYTGTGVISLAGRDIAVDADLRPVNVPIEEGTLTFFWSFEGEGCAARGVENVRIAIGALFDDVVPCVIEGVEGASIAPLPAGEHAWTLTGLAGGDQPVYEASGTSTVPAGGEVQETVDLLGIDVGA